MNEWDDVTGVTYRKAMESMAIVKELLKQRENRGFADKEEVVKFAEGIHVMLRAYSVASKHDMYVNRFGELVTKTQWYETYGDVLYYTKQTEEKVKRVIVAPEGLKYAEEARCIGEQSDGLREPLYHRNYFLPKGYYDEVKGTFNAARPFRYFARQTGADTSHIYELLKHTAGDNYVYVLAWLREKMMNPTKKTEVVPVFIGAQGTGKSTFGESLCTALFEEENVIVGDQYDASARFNSDYADALIVCMEEKQHDDKRNDASTIKSRTTQKRVRKELKGVDPIYQLSFTEHIMTSNNDVTVKFDSPEQRRFMVMEVDPEFTRADSKLADEVFTKLYGFDGKGRKAGEPLTEDGKTIEQFKWELLNNKVVAETSPRDFVKTEAYYRQFSMPRTNEAVEVEMLIKSLAPFIQQSLIKHQRITDAIVKNDDGDEMAISLLDVTQCPEGFMFVRAREDEPERVAINRLAIFCDNVTQKPFAHSVVERGLLGCKKWLQEEYGLLLLGKTEPPSNGFRAMGSRYRMSPAAWFVLDGALANAEPGVVMTHTRSIGLAVDGNVVEIPQRDGDRKRYTMPDQVPYADPKGELETVNEMHPGAKRREAQFAMYIDTFLLECDETTPANIKMEEKLLKSGIMEIEAEDLYVNRLRLQMTEMERLFKEQVICRAVYSGMKSIHMLVRVDPSPLNLEERRWLFAYLCRTLSTKLTFDSQVGDPVRLTRYPKEFERETHTANGVRVFGIQRPLRENWAHIYKLHWRPMYEAWKEQPKDRYEQKGRSMLPTKEIYRDAARAILEGTFFTDKRWDGRRQECFFPAYRIVRALGYTENQVWLDLAEQIKGYPKVDERAYWMSRRDCKLIQAIEGDLDE